MYKPLIAGAVGCSRIQWDSAFYFIKESITSWENLSATVYGSDTLSRVDIK